MLGSACSPLFAAHSRGTKSSEIRGEIQPRESDFQQENNAVTPSNVLWAGVQLSAASG